MESLFVPGIMVMLFAFLLTSCNSEEVYEKITGKWDCVSWTSEAHADNQCFGRDVYFVFNDDRTYKSKLGAEIDSGTFNISGRNLTVNPINKLDINVEILRLTQDSLSFLMNAGGIEEKMLFEKVTN
ncbi:MAG: hypothetical protein EA412_09775 [Chitinophagaceae bacterium]|nr:MAG: hypothetical protein EA412_09775 [Chitinophagaceae bacterium]